MSTKSETQYESKKKYQDRNKAYVNDYLRGSKCVDCGESELVLLEFDHVRGTKVRGIARMINLGNSLKMLEAEIEKCEVRCVECHFLNRLDSSKPQRLGKQFIQAFLTKCEDCGNDDKRILQFDHVKGSKTTEVSRIAHSICTSAKLEKEKPRLMREILKCQVRCIKCHRKKTALERNWYNTTHKE